MAHSYWQPVLEGALQTQAIDAIDAIAGDLARAGPAVAATDPFVALFFAYRARATGDQMDAERAWAFLDHASESLPPYPGLYGGFTGVAWTAAHLTAVAADGDDGGANDEVDDVLLELLDQQQWAWHFDLITGLVGLGVYALERREHPVGRECVGRIVGWLDRMATRVPEGTTWFTPPHLLVIGDVDVFDGHEGPTQLANMGVAHGVPGVIGFLGAALAAGIAEEPARPLLVDGARWLLAQRRDRGFPATVARPLDYTPARLAWCYGDAGIAASLLGAARAAGLGDVEAAAIEIAHRAAGRPRIDAGVKDTGLCHGAAGLAHCFNRIYQATGDPTCRAEALSWYEAALDRRRPGTGVGGYQSFMPKLDAAGGIPDAFEWRDEPGFLTGAAGVGLALIAGTTGIEPRWDRLLLLPPVD